MRICRLAFVAVAMVGICTSREGLANGYKILCVRSTKATAMGEAFIAQADDPTAVAFNPAGLGQVTGVQVSVHGTLCNAFIEHTARGGGSTDNESPWQLVPSAFIAGDFGVEGMGFGLGITVPNGLSSEWAEDSFARYVATFSDLQVADVSPALAVEVGGRLRLGAGLNLLYSRARLEKMIDWGAPAGFPGMFDGEQVLKSEGTGYGFNLGAIFAVNAKHRIACTYRSPVTVDYDGDLTLRDIPPAAGMGTTLKVDAEASIDYPASVVLGYAWMPTERCKVEVNLDWTDWDPVDSITVEFDAPGMADAVLAQDFHNTIAYKLGAEYLLNQTLALRGGYIYNQNATDEEAWRPSLVDTDSHLLSAGVGCRLGDVTVDAAVQLVFYEPRSIDNNVDMNESISSSTVDGKYEGWAPCVSLGATYRF